MITHPSAICCWCRSPLVFYQGWWCPQQACAAKQAKFATIAKDEGKGVVTYLYVPSPIQAQWHEQVYNRSIRRLLVGGSAGPGKSRWMREVLYLLAQEVPGLHALLLRRTHKDLDQSHLRFMPFEVEQRGGKWKGTDKIAVFLHKGHADSVIRSGHMEDDSAIQNYLSSEYDIIAPDELVTFGRDVMLELFTRARTTNPAMIALRGIPEEDYDGALILSASNPGGRGGLWVKDFFIDRQPDPDEFPDYIPDQWRFLPARLHDNPYLKVGGYVQSLSSLPAHRKQQLLDGDWSLYEGQFFTEFREKLHVRSVDGLNPAWKHFLSLDWGFNTAGVCLWWICLPDGHFHIRHEYKFNAVLGERQTVKDVALDIKRRCRDMGLAKVPVCFGDPDLYKFKGQIAESPAETFTRWGVPMGAKPDDKRKHGWQRVREMLRLAPDGTPWLTFEPSCTYTLRTLPMLAQSDKDPDDARDGGDDHAADALRFGALSRIAFRSQTPKKEFEYMSVGWFRNQQQPANAALLGSESVGRR